MPETLQRDYQSVSNMAHTVSAVSWKKFYVHLAGRTNDAHNAIVRRLKSIGQQEVSSPEDSDYLLVFCPIASRVGTDISEALGNTPGDKPRILVVMHHTFDGDHVVANSGRLVNRPNVYLTVDFLFYEGNLLNFCRRNDTAFSEVQMFFGVPTSQVSRKTNLDCSWSNLKILIIVFCCVLVALLIIVPVIVWGEKEKRP